MTAAIMTHPLSRGPARTVATVTVLASLGPTLLVGQETPVDSASLEPLDPGPRAGYVNDLAGVIDLDSRNTMEDLASEVRRKSKGDIVVVTLPTLGGRTPEALAAELTARWDVGYRGVEGDPANDTGVLVILAVEDREFSIQVQDGMRAFFPDAAIRELVTTKAIEPFRAGEYGVGLAETVRGLAQVFAQRFQFELESR